MEEREIDGKIYVLKSEIDTAIKSRIQKLTTKISTLEENNSTLQEQLDMQSGKLGTIDNLNEQIKQLGDQLTKSESRYSRDMALSKLGFQDEELRELIDWSYSRATKDNEDAPSLLDWVNSIKEDPTIAPASLRPHLQQSSSPSQDAPQSKSEPPQPEAVQQPPPPQAIPPRTNTGAVSAPNTNTDLMKRAGSDFDFYRANRQAIIDAYRKGKK